MSFKFKNLRTIGSSHRIRMACFALLGAATFLTPRVISAQPSRMSVSPLAQAQFYAVAWGLAQGRLDLPVNFDALHSEYEPVEYDSVRNLVDLEKIFTAVSHGGSGGLTLDLTELTELLDGTEIDPADIYGSAYTGPYPFEAEETTTAYKRFRQEDKIRGGQATLGVGRFFRDKYNSEGWRDHGRVCLRLDLWLEAEGRDRHLGVYDTFVNFRRTDSGFVKLPTIVEGPFVNLLRSDDPTRLTISFRTDEPIEASVLLSDGRVVRDRSKRRRHEIEIAGLKPDSALEYWVNIGTVLTRRTALETAPAPGQPGVTFCYTGDSREGVGGGMLEYMGVNYRSLERLLALAERKGAEFFLMGGDLINGYTTAPADFSAQLYAWKQAVAGFWNRHPVYPAMGNHEALLNVYREKADGKKVRVDKWPYSVKSAEALFAEAFINPTNGPEPSDKRRPPYEESVYSFQYGNVKAIAFNNNYWYTNQAKQIGGAPEGYIFPDQLDWLRRELNAAENDPSVKYVLLFAQEPVFPNGGHVADAMWYDGDNNVRPYSWAGERLVPETMGVIESRNAFTRMVADCPKVAAVLGSDEHSYHRILIDEKTPVGVPSEDDRNGDGKIGGMPSEPCSPLGDLEAPVWFVVSGGGGAPFYAEQPTPWNQYWKAREFTHTGERAYYYSSQENILIFHASDMGISMAVYNINGELIDQVPDLMAVRKK